MITRYSDHAANERTFLAWVRTAIALMAFGFVIERFDLFLRYAAPLAAQQKIAPHRGAFANAVGLAVMVFGGFAPFFVTWLIQATGVPVAPAFYVMFGAAAGLLAALFLKERARDADLAATDVRVALN